MKTRNWRKYNSLEIYLNKFRKQDQLRIRAIKQFSKELKEMNRRKKGRPYRYTHTTILYILLLLIIFGYSLREVIAYIKYYALLKKYQILEPYPIG